MLTTTYIRENKERVLQGLRTRNWPEDRLHIVDEIIAADDARKKEKTELDDMLAERNRMSKEIGGLFKQGKKDEANALRAKVNELKDRAEKTETELNDSRGRLEEMLLQLPNVPHPSVPGGTTEEDNEVYREWEGDLPELGDDAKPHWELAKDFNIFDMELGVKIAGAGFILYRKNGAKLQRALINFFLDEADRAGYEEVMPPHLVNEDSARGTGQLPDKEGQMYHTEKDNLYLIPTAEVPITNILRGDIVEEADLPIKFTGYTPCFRREAGSYGAHVRGLNRVHQFDKVEIVQAVHPDKSYAHLDEMVEHVAGLLNKLELPYRILRLCGGDIGFTSALTFDFESYSAAQKRWLEVSSVSNFETFQANRLKLRYRDAETKKVHLAHTLNGSALALARIVATIIENNQTPEGIRVPKVLQSYMGGTEILR